MRQIKIIYKESLPYGVKEIEDEINNTLKEISNKNGIVKNISYNSSDAIGRVNSAIIEYDI